MANVVIRYTKQAQAAARTDSGAVGVFEGIFESNTTGADSITGIGNMAGGEERVEGISPATHTTSAEDQAEVAKLQARIAQSNAASEGVASGEGSSLPSLCEWASIPSVQIDGGAHKYVLILATEPAPRSSGSACLRRDFVVSRRGAAYHRNAAEPLVYLLERNGYTDIRITGGGRILKDESKKKIHIFGYSYGFGAADHARSKQVVEADERYKDFNVTWSNDGY